MVKSLLLLGGLASLPALSFAQAGADASGPYLGLGTSLLTSQPFTDRGGSTLWGPALTGGVSLAPRLALELGLAYAGRNTHREYNYYDYNTGRPIKQSIDGKEKVYTFPLLLRATLTPLASRLHADVLGGATYLRATYTEQETYSTGLSRAVPESPATNRAIASLGPGLRFACTPHIEVAANALVNYAFFEGASSFNNHLFLNTRLGVHYTFTAR